MVELNDIINELKKSKSKVRRNTFQPGVYMFYKENKFFVSKDGYEPAEYKLTADDIFAFDWELLEKEWTLSDFTSKFNSEQLKVLLTLKEMLIQDVASINDGFTNSLPVMKTLMISKIEQRFNNNTTLDLLTK